MENTEVEKTMAFVNRDMIGYEPNTIIYRTIIKKLTGSISLLSFDTGQGLPEKTSPFDTFVQVIDGRAEIVIDGTLYLLDAG
jgi:quercetin dioxygenase-like cupin family protein